MLTSNYVQYVRSSEWENRRANLLLARGSKCEACGFEKRLHLHHLTYARLFKEDDADLLLLCAACHEKVERGKDAGAIPRRGKPDVLRHMTLAFITAPPAPVFSMETRNDIQRAIVQTPRVLERMRTLSRKAFRSFLRSERADDKFKCNALVLWDRLHRA